jgi:hypothetical protein
MDHQHQIDMMYGHFEAERDRPNIEHDKDLLVTFVVGLAINNRPDPNVFDPLLIENWEHALRYRDQLILVYGGYSCSYGAILSDLERFCGHSFACSYRPFRIGSRRCQPG